MSVIGSYPCCAGDLWLDMPDGGPHFMPEDCPHCGAKVWHKLTRVDPTSWTEADFLEEFTVDHETKTVLPKAPPISSAEAFVTDRLAKLIADRIVEEILNGSPGVTARRLGL